MSVYSYDLHIHSCLSPCADNDMTPENIAGMGHLNSLDIMALTDHNSVKNCPAFFKAAARYGIIPIPGMELTTSEDIHMICLFPTLENALDFGDFIDKNRVYVKNRAEVFGDQIIMDENDREKGREDFLLPNATKISFDEAPGIVKSFFGACFPAHIDRTSNGVIGVLGAVPEKHKFACLEFSDRKNVEKYASLHFDSEKTRAIVSSDAHFLWKIAEGDETISIDAAGEENVRKKLIEMLS